MVSPLADLDLLASPVASLLILLPFQHLAQTCGFSNTWLPNFLSCLPTRSVWFSPAITHWHTHTNSMCRLIGLSGCWYHRQTSRQTDLLVWLQLPTCRSPYAHACWMECPVMQERNWKCSSMTGQTGLIGYRTWHNQTLVYMVCMWLMLFNPHPSSPQVCSTSVLLYPYVWFLPNIP